MLMLLFTIPRPVGNSKRARALHHKGNRVLGDAHLGRGFRARGFEFFVRDAVGDEAWF